MASVIKLAGAFSMERRRYVWDYSVIYFEGEMLPQIEPVVALIRFSWEAALLGKG